LVENKSTPNQRLKEIYNEKRTRVLKYSIYVILPFFAGNRRSGERVSELFWNLKHAPCRCLYVLISRCWYRQSESTSRSASQKLSAIVSYVHGGAARR